jgi:hypothetical protein
MHCKGKESEKMEGSGLISSDYHEEWQLPSIVFVLQ